MAMLVITRWYPSFWDTIVPGGFSGALPFLLPRGGWCYSNGPALNVGHGCITWCISVSMSISRFDYLYHSISTSFYIYIYISIYVILIWHLDWQHFPYFLLCWWYHFRGFAEIRRSQPPRECPAWIRLLISLWICCLCLILPGSQELPEEELSKTGVGKRPKHHPTIGETIPNRYLKMMFKIPQARPNHYSVLPQMAWEAGFEQQSSWVPPGPYGFPAPQTINWSIRVFPSFRHI